MPPPPAAGGEEGRPVAWVGVPVGVVDAGDVSGVVAGEVAGVLVLAPSEPLPAPSDVAGDCDDGDGVVVEGEHAETAAKTSTVIVAQPMMVSVALRLTRATASRTFMRPPHASRQVAALFSGPGTRNRRRKGARMTTGRWPKAGPRKPAATMMMPMDGGHTMK
ncbi:MAG TPA: hypothetical protein VKD66_01620 [Streptosporangiaceae bacterium]|nr:hypothetical protein [Streptosporangiaceae bacterium]